MALNHRRTSPGVLIGVAAVVACLVLFGLFTDGFGLFGTEMAPGTTVPPNAPS